jgi:hypothetical protein|tara:strand:+ start:14631 stop:15212 length:582 start_codon:yes stop_codon:yes gene_type:complete
MIIGITGKARSGKDTIGDHLEESLGFTKVSLAEPIKRVVKDVFQLTDFQTYDEVEREKPLEHWPDWTPRKLFQFVGTESFRELIDPQIWIKSLWVRIQNDLKDDPNTHFVITDLRFPDELDFLTKNVKSETVFKTIKVTRPNCDGNVGIQGHATESHNLETDFVIVNDSDIIALYTETQYIVGKIISESNEGN